jgi:hypothetical protein
LQLLQATSASLAIGLIGAHPSPAPWNMKSSMFRHVIPACEAQCFIGFSLCLLFAGPAAGSGANVKPGDRDYPQHNAHPVHFLVLHGTIDKSLDLNFRVEWHSALSKCRYAVSRSAGVYSWYTAFDALAIASADTHFSVRVPIDGVLPGRCMWTFGGCWWVVIVGDVV